MTSKRKPFVPSVWVVEQQVGRKWLPLATEVSSWIAHEKRDQFADNNDGYSFRVVRYVRVAEGGGE